MRDAVGGSLLLNLVVIIVSAVILFFVGILTYSKAYRIKNRIIEIIEKYESYDSGALSAINDELKDNGYLVSNLEKIENKCGQGNLNSSTYLYCVYEHKNYDDSKTYKVVTYTRFEFPVIGDILMFPVRGETKTLGKQYNY